MSFGSSAENKRLEKAVFTQLISLETTGTSVLFKTVEEITLPSCSHSTDWLHLSTSCRSWGDPLTYIKIYAVKRSKFMGV